MKSRPTQDAAFTLIELLVGMGVLVLMFGLLMTAMNGMTRTMGNTTAKVEQFRGARDAFERITSRLSQATLNTYTDYRYGTDASGQQSPVSYERRSELRFLSGHASEILSGTPGMKLGHCVFFAAPLGVVKPDGVNRGLENALNVTGFYVEYDTDKAYRPKFVGAEVPERWRWRLMEYMPPCEDFPLYNFTSGGTTADPKAVSYKAQTWIVDANGTKFRNASRPVVENVIALVVAPRLAREEESKLQSGNKDVSPLAPLYRYDSTGTNINPKLNPKNQLPPVVQVTMVAIDERSSEKLSLDADKGDLFNVSTRFRTTDNFSKDLLLEVDSTNSLSAELNRSRVNYRIFTTNVHLRSSKWSREQTDKP